MKVPDEVNQQRQRHQLLASRNLRIGQQPRIALDLRRDAIAVLARGFEVERLAHVDVLIMPAVDIGKAVPERLDAVGPNAGLLDRRNRTFGRFQQPPLP